MSAELAREYGRLAEADFQAFNDSTSGLSRPHRLMFLQMACEKLVKAYLARVQGMTLDQLRRSHAFTSKYLWRILDETMANSGVSRNRILALHSYSKMLAREIELLSPAVDDSGKRPDNCEYPWTQGGLLMSPLDHSFVVENLLADRAKFVTVQQAIKIAIIQHLN